MRAAGRACRPPIHMRRALKGPAGPHVASATGRGRRAMRVSRWRPLGPRVFMGSSSASREACAVSGVSGGVGDSSGVV